MRVNRVCDDAYEKFLERHVQGMEEDLPRRDQRGLFQRLKSVNIENTRKVRSQYIRNEEGMTLQDPGLVFGRWARFFSTPLNAKYDSDSTSSKDCPSGLSYTLSRSNQQKTS